MADHRARRVSMRSRVVAAVALSVLTLSMVPQTAFAETRVHTIIRTLTRRSGFVTADVTAMKRIADWESHDNPRAVSGRCRGLFQLHGGSLDAKKNTSQALRYVRRRYGNPRKALAHIRRVGWY